MDKGKVYFYAQLDKNKVYMGISQLPGEMNASNMICLTEI